MHLDVQFELESIASDFAALRLPRRGKRTYQISSNAVTVVQQKLNEWLERLSADSARGHSIPPITNFGKYDRATAEIVRAYQMEQNRLGRSPRLAVDGEIGYEMIVCLFSELEPLSKLAGIKRGRSPALRAHDERLSLVSAVLERSFNNWQSHRPKLDAGSPNGERRIPTYGLASTVRQVRLAEGLPQGETIGPQAAFSHGMAARGLRHRALPLGQRQTLPGT